MSNIWQDIVNSADSLYKTLSGQSGPGPQNLGDVAAGNAFKQTVGEPTKLGLTVANAPLQLAQGAVRDIAGQLNGSATVKQPMPWEQTTIYQALKIARDTGNWNPDYLLGNGTFLPALGSPAATAQAKAARDAASINGHAWTPGRQVATWLPDVVAQPGSTGYNIVSGGIDALASIVMDPTTYLSGGLSRARFADGAFHGAVVDSAGEAEVHAPVALRSGGLAVPEAPPRTLPEPPIVTTGEATDASGATRTVTGTIAPPPPPASPLDHPSVAAGRQSLVHGARPTFMFDQAQRWINSSDFDQLAQVAANATSSNGGFEVLRRLTNRKWPTSLILQLVDAKDPAEVKQVITSALEKDVIDAPANPVASDLAKMGLDPKGGKVAAYASTVMRRSDARWRQYRPDSLMLRRDSPDDAVETFDRWQRAVGHTDPVTISKNNEALARQLALGYKGNFEGVVKNVAETLRQNLLDNGVSNSDASTLTRLWGEARTQNRAFWVDQTGQNVGHTFAKVGDNGLAAPAPHASSEFFDGNLELPNPGDLRSALGTYRRLAETVGNTSDAARRAMLGIPQHLGNLSDAGLALFKLLVLGFRPVSFIVRNVAEAQLRVGAIGHSGAFNHPLDYMSYLLAHNPDSPVARTLSKIPMVAPRGAEDALGQSFVDAAHEAEMEGHLTQFQQVLEHGFGQWGGDAHLVRTGQFVPMQKGAVQDAGDYLNAVHFTYAKLAAAPAYRKVAQEGATQGVKDWFWNSAERQKLLNQPNGQGAALADRFGADQYINEVADRIKQNTNGDPALIEAIAHGRVEGEPLLVRGKNGTLKPNPKALRKLDAHYANLPDMAVGEVRVNARHGMSPIGVAAQKLDAAGQTLMHLVGSVPENLFIREPAYREFYWNQAKRSAPLLSPEDNAHLIEQAKRVNMPRDFVNDLSKNGGKGNLSLDDLDGAWKERAKQDVFDSFYTSHEKQNWTHTLRYMMPFAAAWQDTMKFYAKRVLNPMTGNPLVLHRVERAINGARAAGFFYTDDQTGQERFVYPGSTALNKALTGVPVPLTGSVAGLNIVTNGVLPGYGPAVTVAASKLLPDDPKWDVLRNQLLPYGPTDSNLIRGQLPTWLQKMSVFWDGGSPANQRAMQQSIKNTMAYLMSTGDYDQSSQQDMERLVTDAQNKGRALFLIRALAQSAAPSSPSDQWYVKDTSGRLVTMATLAQDYKQFMKEDPNTADAKLLTTWGPVVYYAMAPSTQGGGGATVAAGQLARSTKAPTRYPDVWSMFTDPTSPYDPQELQRRLADGTARSLSANDVVTKAQTNMGWALYSVYKQQYGDNKAVMDQVKTAIQKKLPMWNPAAVDLGRIPTAINEIQRATQDPQVSDLPAVQAASIYLNYRTQIEQAAAAAGIKGWQQANSTANGRAILRAAGTRILQDYPQFQQLWSRVFEPELGPEPTQTQQGGQ